MIFYWPFFLTFFLKETTSTAVSWALYALAHNPDVEQKVFEEIYSILGADGVPTRDNIEKFKYLSNTIKETLRVYPSVPMISRHAEEDDILAGQFIPKGVQVTHTQTHTHTHTLTHTHTHTHTNTHNTRTHSHYTQDTRSHSLPQTVIIISPLVLHNLPSLWDNPEKFDPTRFEAERIDQKFIPFLEGKRNW